MQQVQFHATPKTAPQHRGHSPTQPDSAMFCAESGTDFKTLLETPETASAETVAAREAALSPSAENERTAPAAACPGNPIQTTDAAVFMLAVADVPYPATSHNLPATSGARKPEIAPQVPGCEPENRMPIMSAGTASSDIEPSEIPDPSTLLPPGPVAAPQGAATLVMPVPTATGASVSVASPATQGAAVPLDAIPFAIAAQVHEGTRRFEIRLDPAELGRVDIRLDIDADGSVRAHLIVERPGTLQNLQQDAPKLEQALASAGASLDQGGLSFSLKQEQPGTPPHHARRTDQDTGNAASEPRSSLPAPRSLTLRAHLDLLA